MAKNAKQLASEHTDPEWRRRYSDLCDLIDILADCFIDSDYSVPDALNAALALSASGNSLHDRLIRKEQVPPKEARLMCALVLGHEDLFIDVERSDLEKLRNSISTQLLEGDIRFPFTFGRELYDSFAAMFEEEKDELGLEETLRLLDTIPAGVFQYGRYIVGPFGLLESQTQRDIPSSRRVPAFHCSQAVCHVVHRTYLTTSQNATINSQRHKVHRILDETDTRASEWWGLPHEFRQYLDSYYNDLDVASYVGLIGDSLDLAELRLLLADLLDSTKGSVRNALPSGLVGSASGITEPLQRNQLLQLILLASETQIAASLDRLIRTEAIQVRPGDVRRPVVNVARRSGAFELSAELGHSGARLTSGDQGVPGLRLRRLLKKLYLRGDQADSDELEWQLRGFEAEDLDERLEDFYQATTPRQALERMVLARKSNLITACHEVRLEEPDGMSDADLIEAVLWKLGFDVHVPQDPHEYFWDLQERLASLTRSSRISGSGESERFRGVASSYFTELEGLLADALAFSTWLLTADHTAAAHPFEYDDESDRMMGLAALQLAHDRSENPHEIFDYASDKIELYALLRGFGILAKELERLETVASDLERPEGDYPDYDGRTTLKSFVFRSTCPFLNLTEASRRRIREDLSEISRLLVEKEVHQVRNDYSHYRRNARDVSTMTEALEAVASAVRMIENLGFARILCWPTDVTSDPWGRSQHNFAGPRSVTHLFARPSNYDWMGLPSLTSPQYIVHSAAFAEPNEVLRFARRFDSPFARMWSDYPKRRMSGAAPTVAESDVGDSASREPASLGE